MLFAVNEIIWMNIPRFVRSNVPTQVDTNAVKFDPNLPGTSSRIKRPHTAVTLDRWSATHGLRQGSEENRSSIRTRISGHEQSSVDDASLCSTSPVCVAPIIRQFWKAGVYNDELTPKSTTQSGSSYLHIHPRFLHSNATSHKWVFGAVAELIDNAVDEIQNGATFVIIDKTSNPRNGSSALLIQDDGSGMNPEAMRRCLSFGFSDKKSISAIGKSHGLSDGKNSAKFRGVGAFMLCSDGNGFKTSSMRLGADVIVFSRNQSNRTMTQSIGLLSYTFLTRMGYNRVVVPMVHYEFNTVTGSFDSVHSKSNETSNLNLSLMLQWSPYSTEEELLKQFEDVGPHGTKVIAYNLWLDEDRNMELDFESDPEVLTGSSFVSCICMENKDIRITRDAHGEMKDGSRKGGSHIANRLRYSLRAYLSILYLKLPETFAMMLRGKVILYHNVATDLKYTEFIVYKPHIASTQVEPFCPVVSFSANRGRGVVGVLEANFIEPTHDKQDFEKTSLFQKLVQRLKEMTWEYWDCHCGLIGYQFQKKGRPPSAAPGYPNFIHHHGTEPPALSRKSAPVGSTRNMPKIITINSRAALGSNPFAKPPGLTNTQEAIYVMQENRRLRSQCNELQKAQAQLKLKVTQLKMELEAAKAEYAHMLAELQYVEKVKAETCIHLI
ncbi:Histidine kinase-like ATPase, ATP-binding domain-containing protein [Cynara cardunculus var. scolymus]|uniref:Histidine kinase-like ATPase, ATP-binding domain-containing protein n=1 Tax=Cynara cardunculus var. scolymus TaxID=59895 RepID=A0A103XWK2_CYNCS|nr:Histidine kinase-like ATPase, ATP-binding domain-containing protein [Cynara cardunculus var. scolymus]